MTGLYWEEWEVGAEFFTSARTITEADIVNFAGISGDYNPLHDHGVMSPGGLSMILYLQVPECISSLPDPDDKGGSIWFNDSSGDVDGFTYFIWAQRNQDMLRKLYPVGEEYFKPKVGSLLIFPNWLKHAVMPFYGEGERRTLAGNANIISPELPQGWSWQSYFKCV